MSDVSVQAASACVVIPTYNNCSTIGSVVEEARRFVPDVVVVNDGSTDDTAGVLEKLPGIEVITHDRKTGKGASLADGFTRAAEKGFSHALTIDGDGQHLPTDIPKFLKAIEENPEALVIGVRELSGRGRRLKSRLLRVNSDFWVRLFTRKKIHDSQSGFRAYPLSSIQSLVLKTKKYDYEIEVLVKAAWSGVPVVEVPVQVEYGPGSASHFRPIRDFMLVAHLNFCLFMQIVLIPAPVRGIMHLKSEGGQSFIGRILKLFRRSLVESFSSAERFSLSVGLGVFFGIVPIWGFQMAAAFLVAHKLRLSRAVSVAASNISFPAAIPFILYGSLMLGRLSLKGTLDGALRFDEVSLETVWNYASEYVVGSFILAAAAALVATGLSYLTARLFMVVRRSRA